MQQKLSLVQHYSFSTARAPSQAGWHFTCKAWVSLNAAATKQTDEDSKKP